MIPLKAQPVVDVLRADVPRPTILPKRCLTIASFGCPRWEDGSCPMGLHPKSHDEEPYFHSDFAGGLCSTKAVQAFADWWDGQYDANAAIDAIWPPQTD